MRQSKTLPGKTARTKLVPLQNCTEINFYDEGRDVHAQNDSSEQDVADFLRNCDFLLKLRTFFCHFGDAEIQGAFQNFVPVGIMNFVIDVLDRSVLVHAVVLDQVQLLQEVLVEFLLRRIINIFSLSQFFSF